MASFGQLTPAFQPMSPAPAPMRRVKSFPCSMEMGRFADAERVVAAKEIRLAEIASSERIVLAREETFRIREREETRRLELILSAVSGDAREISPGEEGKRGGPHPLAPPLLARIQDSDVMAFVANLAVHVVQSSASALGPPPQQ